MQHIKHTDNVRIPNNIAIAVCRATRCARSTLSVSDTAALISFHHFDDAACKAVMSNTVLGDIVAGAGGYVLNVEEPPFMVVLPLANANGVCRIGPAMQLSQQTSDKENVLLFRGCMLDRSKTFFCSHDFNLIWVVHD